MACDSGSGKSLGFPVPKFECFLMGHKWSTRDFEQSKINPSGQLAEQRDNSSVQSLKCEYADWETQKQWSL
jgi:hypothetical protein